MRIAIHNSSCLFFADKGERRPAYFLSRLSGQHENNIRFSDTCNAKTTSALDTNNLRP